MYVCIYVLSRLKASEVTEHFNGIYKPNVTGGQQIIPFHNFLSTPTILK
jgi:hypothetical protein